MLSVAAVDVGSNAIRLAVVKVGSTGVATQAYNHRYAVRLGGDVFAHGNISDGRIRELVKVFEDIARRVARFGVEDYRAVATSAMRDAKNGARVVDRVRRATGLEIEVISGHEEGRLTRLTLMRALGTVPHDALLVDLGGGSVELEHTSGLDGRSLPLGTVRLIQRYPQLVRAVDMATVDQIGERIKRELEQKAKAVPAEIAIGTGGNLDALARLVPHRRSPVPAIDLARLRSFTEQLARLSPAERGKRYQLRRDRADVILPAALIILALAETYGLQTFVVPGTGIRESILFSLASQANVATHARDVLAHLGQDLQALDRRARIARRLFELTAAIHGLWTPGLAPLEAAAYFLDAGALIDPENAPQHTAYLLEHSAGLELDAHGRRVAAIAAVSSLGARATTLKRGLPLADQKAADTLAAVLTLAAALAEHSTAAEPTVSLLTDPIEIDVGLLRRLPPDKVAPLERLLHRRIKVR